MDFEQAIKAYFEKFNEGPPVIGMEEAEAIKKIQDAIENNQIIEEGAEADLPDDVII